jgi:hypothetical protein
MAALYISAEFNAAVKYIWLKNIARSISIFCHKASPKHHELNG